MKLLKVCDVQIDKGTETIELEILYISGFVCPMFVNVVHKGTLVRCLAS